MTNLETFRKVQDLLEQALNLMKPFNDEQLEKYGVKFGLGETDFNTYCRLCKSLINLRSAPHKLRYARERIAGQIEDLIKEQEKFYADE